jgi:hypothetical protein
MIVGFDSDTLYAFVQQFEFLQAAGIPSVLLAMLNALDGTPLQRRLADEGRLKPLLLSDAALDTNIVPKQMTSQQLVRGTVWLLNRLYAPQAFLERLAVLAGQLPRQTAAERRRAATDVDAAFWTRLARSYATLGPDLREVPLAAASLFRGRDPYPLRAALVFYRSAVSVLRRWGVWDPRLGEQAAPDFASRP